MGEIFSLVLVRTTNSYSRFFFFFLLGGGLFFILFFCFLFILNLLSFHVTSIRLALTGYQVTTNLFNIETFFLSVLKDENVIKLTIVRK